MSLKRLRDELRELRQAVKAKGSPQFIAVGNDQEAAEVRRRLPANADVIIVKTGIVRR